MTSATDVELSAGFYATLVAWRIRVRGDGARAFDDTTALVSGVREPAANLVGLSQNP